MTKMRSWKSLPIFAIACLITLLIGGLFVPGPWYESINKAPWTPPNIAFPIVWSILYILIAINGWLIHTLNSDQSLKWLWWIQLFINAAWSWIFFGKYWTIVGLVDLILLVTLVSIMIIKCYKQQLRLAAYLLMPYCLWLILATSLNAYIVIYN